MFFILKYCYDCEFQLKQKKIIKKYFKIIVKRTTFGHEIYNAVKIGDLQRQPTRLRYFPIKTKEIAGLERNRGF